MARVGGKELSGTWTLDATANGVEITLESRSGKRGAPNERNADYREVLGTILDLLGQRGCRLDRVELTSAKALRVSPDINARRVMPEGFAFPIELSTVADLSDLGRRIQRAMAGMFSERDEPGGGNREKRITLFVSGDPVNLSGLAIWLADGRTRTAWLWSTDNGDDSDGIVLDAATPRNIVEMLSNAASDDLVYHYARSMGSVIAVSRMIGAGNIILEDDASARVMKPLAGYTRLATAHAMSATQDIALRPLTPVEAAELRALSRADDEEAGMGNPYREAKPPPKVRPGKAASVDPALMERAHASHAATQNALAQALREAGRVPLSPRLNEPEFDVAWRNDEIMHIAEVKSIHDDNEESQLRVGLGQVLRYRHLLKRLWRRPVHAVIALERAPSDPAWIEMCAEHGVDLLWPPFVPARFGSNADDASGSQTS
jgi:hypothetical protein